MSRLHLFAVLLLTATVLSPLEAATTAKITAAVLEVYCRPNASARWARARVGTVLPAGAQVRTGKRSYCEIRFSDGGLVRLAPQSDLTLSKLAGRDMSLGRGKLFANVRRGSGGATVRGGNGVASIKGTTWTNEVTGDGFTTSVIEGNLVVETTLDGRRESYDLGTLEQFSSLVGQTQSLLDLPARNFIDLVFMPWYQEISSGESTAATPAKLAELQVLSQHLQDIAQVLKQDPGPQSGGLIVDVESVHTAAAGKPAPANLLAALPFGPPEALLEVPPLALAQAPVETRVFGKRFLGPDFRADLFGLVGDGPGHSLAGIRVRPVAVWNNLYFEAGVTGWTTFEDGWHTVLSEGLVQARPRCGAVTVGRQHFLDGPVNNSNLGSLLSFDTADAVRFQPRWGKVGFDLAYISDFLPFQSADRSGWFGRSEVGVLKGKVGVNVVHAGGVSGGTGASVDFAVPVVEGLWDLYGEFGDDASGRHLETWGSYFPSLYQRSDLDLFVEYARHSGSDSMLSAYAYKDLPQDWTAFAKLQHTAADHFSIGVGAIKHF